MLSITPHRVIEFTLIFQSLWEKIIQPPAYEYALPWVSEENNQEPQPTHRNHHTRNQKTPQNKVQAASLWQSCVFPRKRCPCLPLRYFKTISQHWALRALPGRWAPGRTIRHKHGPSCVTEFGLCRWELPMPWKLHSPVKQLSVNFYCACACFVY